MAATSSVQFQFGSVVLANTVSQYHPGPYLDPPGMNVIGTRHSLKVKGTLAKGLPPAISGETPAETLGRMKSELMRHRRYFLYAPFGTVVVEVGDPDNPNDPLRNLDIANGPECKGFTVIAIAEACIEIEVEIEATTLACTTDPKRVILSHTFRQRETYDRRGYCTLTTDGLIAIRSDMARNKRVWQILDEADLNGTRDGYQLIEPIEHGFVDARNLVLAYTRTEKEFDTRPTDDAPECEADLIFHNPGNNAAAQAVGMVRMKGAKGVKRSALLVKALRIITNISRKFEVVRDGKTAPILSTRIRVGVMDNVVEIQQTIQADPQKFNDTTGKLRADLFDGYGFEGPGSPAFVPPLYEKQKDDIERAAFQEPCASLADPVASAGKDTSTTRPPRPQGQPASALTGSAQTPTAGPTAGGGGVGSTTITVGPNSQIIDLESEQFIRDFFFPNLSTSPGGGAVPLAVLADYSPIPGGGGSSADTSFGAFGSNPITGTSATPTKPDPVDSPNPYTAYNIRLKISHTTGLKSYASAGPQHTDGNRAPSCLVRINNGKTQMSVIWSATRWGVPPQIPDPVPEDPNYVLTGVDYLGDEVVTNPETGAIRYVKAGSYQYDILAANAAKLFDLLPPQIVRTVQRQYPDGLPGATVARDIIWWGFRKAKPTTLFGDGDAVATPPPNPTNPLPIDGITGPGALGGYHPNPGG
ncbi:hypothetical protein [Limnoglobus roseus]|uniref:Uncharacterized protein n=1 Tax=Limnoglobus roseus TaxID=2598579 RepID=A0A5C1AN76_9BACT|nr:hypothetical protein [Limnoglobus roseus]QEL20440.1 hypothetical protein PX52LOC_07538 [Limnoglobus roseus]